MNIFNPVSDNPNKSGPKMNSKGRRMIQVYPDVIYLFLTAFTIYLIYSK